MTPNCVFLVLVLICSGTTFAYKSNKLKGIYLLPDEYDVVKTIPATTSSTLCGAFWAQHMDAYTIAATSSIAFTYDDPAKTCTLIDVTAGYIAVPHVSSETNAVKCYAEVSDAEALHTWDTAIELVKTGWVATASSEESGAMAAFKAIDDLVENAIFKYWHTVVDDLDRHWIQVDMLQTRTISNIKIVQWDNSGTFNQATNIECRYVCVWTFANLTES